MHFEEYNFFITKFLIEEYLETRIYYKGTRQGP